MPTKPPTRCGRCGQLYTGRKCPNHTWEQASPAWTGKSTSDPRWQGVRRLRLGMNPMCQWPGCTDLGSTVDHLDGTDYADDTGEGSSWLNVAMTRSLCEGHHRRRTSAQGNAAQHRQKRKGRRG